LTGPAAAGKETISKKFMDAGFEVFVFSDILRREAQSRGLLKGSQEEDRMIISKLGDIVRFISGKKDARRAGGGRFSGCNRRIHVR